MTTVIYHSADYDGIFCREIARKFLPDAKLIGWNFGDPLVPIPPEGTIYILDLSPACLEPFTCNGRLVWIDHLKSSIEKWAVEIPGYRLDGVATCRLAWQFFNCCGDHRRPRTIFNPLPSKQDFINRTVIEPLAVQLAGEYEIGDKRNPDAETFQHGLRCVDLDAPIYDGSPTTDRVNWWYELLRIPHPTEAKIMGGPTAVESLLFKGKIAQTCAQNIDADLVNK